MEYIWIISCFDLHRWELFTPSPGAFRTEAEAQRYVAVHNERDKTVLCNYHRMVLGRFGEVKPEAMGGYKYITTTNREKVR